MLSITDQPVMNPTFAITEESSTPTEASLVIEPLEQGYGHTIGNALRRVLLSSLPGAAITKIRLEGVEHQFSTLDGMSEDVVDLILNLKQVRLKAESNKVYTLKLDVSGPASVTAGDIIAEAGIEIVNPELGIATLADKKAQLVAELTVETGVGYRIDQEQEVSGIIGEIPVDALFSPVIKVSYSVEATRVGRRTDFDKVVMHVQTDGSIQPIAAVQQAAQILARQFSQIVAPVTQELVSDRPDLSPEEAETLSLTVEELELPTRIANALRKGGFKTVGDLLGAPRQSIARVKNLGEKSVDVVAEALAKKDVELGE